MSSPPDPFVPKHRLLLVLITKTLNEGLSPYDATRYAWVLDPKRAERAELVLGCAGGVVKSVLVPATPWLDASRGEATRRNFPELAAIATHKDKRRRWGFKGKEAEDEIKTHYLNKRVPDNLKHGQNPIRYSYD